MSRLISIIVSALCLVAVSSTSLTVDKSGLLRREVQHRGSALQVESLHASTNEKCMHSAFNTDALCHAADATLAKFNTANENVECAGTCTEAECCEASKCSNSEFNDDAKCLEANPLKPKFNTAKADEACAAAICTDTECCEAATPTTPIGSASNTPTKTETTNQKCMHSAFNDDAQCFKKDPLLPKFNTAHAEVACVAAICTEAECCEAHTTAAASSEDGDDEDGEDAGVQGNGAEAQSEDGDDEDSEKAEAADNGTAAQSEDGHDEDTEKAEIAGNETAAQNEDDDDEDSEKTGVAGNETAAKSEDGDDEDSEDAGVAGNGTAADGEDGEKDDKDSVVDDDQKEEPTVIHNTHDGTATGVLIHWPKSSWQFEEARERAIRATTVPLKPIPAAKHAGKVEDGYCSNFQEGASMHFNGEEASFWKNVNQEECFSKCDLDRACEQAIFRADTQFCVIGNNVMSAKPVELHADSQAPADLSGHALHAHTTCYGKNGFENHYNVGHHVEAGWCSDWVEGFKTNSSAKQCNLAETTTTSQLECSHWGAEYGLSEKGCWAKCNRNEHCKQAVYENKTDSWSCFIGTGTMQSNTGTAGVSRCHNCNNRCFNRVTADVAKAANVAHVPAQKCSASAFNTDAKCNAADPALPKYIASSEDDKTCASSTCAQHECCEAEAHFQPSNEMCGGSPFNSDAMCAEADSDLPKFNTAKSDVACAAAICTEAECCEAGEDGENTTTAQSEDGEDGENGGDNGEDGESGENGGEHKKEKKDKKTAKKDKKQKENKEKKGGENGEDGENGENGGENGENGETTRNRDKTDKKEKKEKKEKKGGENDADGENGGENGENGETTTTHQKCITSAFDDDAKCLAADANLPKFNLDSQDEACAEAICTQAECCEAEAA